MLSVRTAGGTCHVDVPLGGNVSTASIYHQSLSPPFAISWEIMHVPLCEHACCIRVMHSASLGLSVIRSMFVLQQIKALGVKRDFCAGSYSYFLSYSVVVLLKTIITFNLCKDLGDFYYCCWLKVNFILPETDKALRSSYELLYSVVAFPLLTSRIGMLCVLGDTWMLNIQHIGIYYV